jgi:dihydrofolate synthase/folylpolyglutamate synthase
MPDLSLAEWLRQLEQRHPKAIDLGLDRVSSVARKLGLLPVTVPTVVVGGTNGKGSVVAVLESALAAAGETVGSYTSPHLVDYNERIRINGEPVADAQIVTAFNAIEAARGDVSLTYFEVGTLAALLIFREVGVDHLVLEVGLGGRLDAVNIVDADVSVITSIGLDHQEWLGTDRDQIAFEKAHIARSGRPVIVLEQALPTTLLPTLETLDAKVVLLGRDFSLAGRELHTLAGAALTLPEVPGLLDSNIAGALQALELMTPASSLPELASSLTTLTVPGRRQSLRWLGAELLLDVAHNQESVEALVAILDDLDPAITTYGVYASLEDKPFRDILQTVGTRVDHWYFPRFEDVPRSVDPTQFKMPADGASGQVCADFAAAWEQLRERVAPGDRVLVFGSFITVGAALEQLRAEQEATA